MYRVFYFWLVRFPLHHSIRYRFVPTVTGSHSKYEFQTLSLAQYEVERGYWSSFSALCWALTGKTEVLQTWFQLCFSLITILPDIISSLVMSEWSESHINYQHTCKINGSPCPVSDQAGLVSQSIIMRLLVALLLVYASIQGKFTIGVLSRKTAELPNYWATKLLSYQTTEPPNY